MTEFCQGDIIRIETFKKKSFLIVSKNSFIRATGVFHVCPVLSAAKEGPLHIAVTGMEKQGGIVCCEQVKLIDPGARSCTKTDRIPYGEIMNISDAIQGIFEYD